MSAAFLLVSVLVVCVWIRRVWRGSSFVERQTMKRILKAIAAVVLVVVGLSVLSILLMIPDAKRFRRYCEYPTPEALMAAEPDVVKNVTTVELDGVTYRVLDLGPMGFLPSGCAYIVYDASGRLVDRTLDEGDDPLFHRKWWNPKCR